MTEQNCVQMRSILSIIEIGLEGFEYIVKSKKDGKEDLSLYLLTDFVEAYLSINDAVTELERQLELQDLRKSMSSVELKLLTAADLLMAGNIVDGVSFIEKGLIPQIEVFRQDSLRSFGKYIIN